MVDFKQLIVNISAQLNTLNLDELQTKAINYGQQFKMVRGAEHCILSVYHGKKGIKYVWGGQDSTLSKQAQELIGVGSNSGGRSNEGSVTEATDLTLLGEAPGFHGLWAGSDESGKGDFFGPLVVAAVMLDLKVAQILQEAGIKDCKLLTDKKILQYEAVIKESVLHYSVLDLKPASYNLRYAQLKSEGKNLNNLLASGHINALQNILSQDSKCDYALIDRFTINNNIEAQLLSGFPYLHVIQVPKAERDIAVAAASILARAKFLQIVNDLNIKYDLNIPKGGGAQTTAYAKVIMAEKGRDILNELVKKHFANYKLL